MRLHIRKMALLCLNLTLFAACDNSGGGRGPLVLQLGKPGEVTQDNNLPKNDNVHVLNEDEKITFIKDEGVVEVTHPDGRTIKAGDVIVGNSKDRLLLRVVSVQDVAADRSVLLVQQGQVKDIIGDKGGSYAFTATPVYDLPTLDGYIQKARIDERFGGDSTYTTDANGKIVIRNLDLFSIVINDDGRVQKEDSVTLGKNPLNLRDFSIKGSVGGSYKATLNEAQIEVIPTVKSEADWDGPFIKKMEARLDAKVKYRIDVTYKLSGNVQIEGSVDLLPKLVIPFVAPGPVPVYLDVELDIPAGVSIISQGSNETRVIYEAEYDFFTTSKYDGATGMTSDTRQNNKVIEKSVIIPQSNLSLSAEVYLKPSITTRLYRVIGPNFYIQPYLRGEFEIPVTRKKDDLFIGARGGLGFSFSEPILVTPLWSYELGNITFFEFSWDLDNAGAPTVEENSVQPDTMEISTIGSEGFVVINAKTLAQNPLSRFEILSGTKKGVLVPSENFYMNGEMYYYPIAAVENDDFKVRVIENGKPRDVVVNLHLGPQVLSEISKQRFGVSTNNYRVATGSASDFAGEVPYYSVGATMVAAERPPEEPMDEQGRYVFLQNCLERINQNGDSTAYVFDRERWQDAGVQFMNLDNQCAENMSQREILANLYRDYTDRTAVLEALVLSRENNSISLPTQYMRDFMYYVRSNQSQNRNCTLNLAITQWPQLNLTAHQCSEENSPLWLEAVVLGKTSMQPVLDIVQGDETESVDASFDIRVPHAIAEGTKKYAFLVLGNYKFFMNNDQQVTIKRIERREDFALPSLEEAGPGVVASPTPVKSAVVDR
jgi:hypothetical protein